MMKTINITKKDMCNVGSGAGFKEAAENKVAGKLTGIGIIPVERVDEETGEIVKESVSVVKVGDVLYSGASKVVERRVKNLMEIIGDFDDIEKGKIDVAFEKIKLAKGAGTNLIVTRYDE